jgi:hypothetical protein
MALVPARAFSVPSPALPSGGLILLALSKSNHPYALMLALR